MDLHGPHHSAQKSTRTGVADLETSAAKLSALNVTMLAEAIKVNIKPMDVAPKQRDSSTNSNKGAEMCQARTGWASTDPIPLPESANPPKNQPTPGRPQIRKAVVPTAASPRIAAAIARPLSNPLTVGALATATDGRGATTVAVGLAAAGAAEAVAAGAGRAAGAAAVPIAGAGAAAGGAPPGPPGGSVGSLMVGAAEGLGGRLIRTVSFFGWTLPVSFFGGNAPPGDGILGTFSAIKYQFSKN